MKFTENYKEIPVYEMENAQKLIERDWMLITASDGERTNAMTASWAGLGELWNMHVAFTFIRPQRYTFEFTEKAERVSLAFFSDEYRSALSLCGRKSGRDSDKLKEAGLTVGEIDGVPVIEEARMIVICKKIYADFLKEKCFIDKEPLSHYGAKDFHRVYVLKIERVLVRE